ncbi:group II intron reverse transcriptase/maturase [Clostridium sporogenes]|uniref:group II intron reverse transcriptase/maturase n=1 Tax=Clostridium sporogenes TaxID=1509 RepID=UPI0005EE5092|nr:group II intron reverse transcriptase/maturase [Clostridium sporogenes]NFF79370.1 group II intron reverse transcriptase/maturase [Clostridium sporogenes]NFL79635.1 group II intron reverse transcriptase/maturase [Clostridium sporogenes]NFU41521.1 group II intron reverse transcriptase/maturase [Clostridium sporogenes]NFU79149.1 group II intron reverse transcriptase/maturase [Clostridium sporogenes]
MNNSNKLQRKQITQYRGRLVEVEVEIRGKQGAQSNNLALAKRERENNVLEDTNNLLERVLARENMLKAMKRVIANKGSHGVDGMRVDELRTFIINNWLTIKQKLLEGRYKPSPVRRVDIPKPDGGIRLLGIPTVLDRLIQQAIAQELNKIYDHTFSDSSYGFRPNKSSKQAIVKARQYINDGYRWVVDMDLEKFFDKVNHDILMERLSRKIRDKRLLKLIREYLKSGIMLNGIKVKSDEGTPQGGPLSPLLANILLDEVDKELEKRGHKFCRFADDSNVYVKSRKAGLRVMASMRKILEGGLKLKVNENKSAVDLVTRRKFLGFSFYFGKGGANIRIHEKSYKRFENKIRNLTNRNTGINMEYRIKKLNQLTVGWINYFGVAKANAKIKELDRWIRRRLRACIWKQWKKVKTRGRNLIKLGLPTYKAWEYANTRKSYWRVSNSPILHITLDNKYLETLNYKSISKRYQLVHNS